eukprot:2785289-Rhodomonas_salina.2
MRLHLLRQLTILWLVRYHKSVRLLGAACYAAATGCPVLTYGMLLPGGDQNTEYLRVQHQVCCRLWRQCCYLWRRFCIVWRQCAAFNGGNVLVSGGNGAIFGAKSGGDADVSGTGTEIDASA